MTPQSGVAIEDTTLHILIRNCRIETTEAWAEVVVHNASNVRIEDCEVIGSVDHGIVFRDAVNCTITGCYIANNMVGIKLFNLSRDSVISGNTIADCQVGVSLADVSTANHVVGNLIHDISDDGIAIHSDGNVIEKNDLADCGIHAIVSYGGNMNTIIENTIAGVLRGIKLIHAATGNEIVGNRFADCPFDIVLSEENRETLVYGNSLRLAKDWSPDADWHNGLIGNYWGAGTTSDFDADGIGEQAHTIDGPEQRMDLHPLVLPWSRSVAICSLKLPGTEESIVVANWTDAEADLAGWRLQCVDAKGDQVLGTVTFSEGFRLDPWTAVRIHAARGSGTDEIPGGEFVVAETWDGWDSDPARNMWPDTAGIARLLDNDSAVIQELLYDWQMIGWY